MRSINGVSQSSLLGLNGKPSFHIVNLGCKVNRVEADAMRSRLLAQGGRDADAETADLVIVNTCTVTGEADRKARKAVRHALAANPLAEVIVTGCSAALNPNVFESMSPRVRVISKGQLEKALDPTDVLAPLRVGKGFNTRVGLKVQDGCNRSCSYCIVHVARGPARSKPLDEVAREARAYFEAGVKEVVLTGIDIGAYDDRGRRLSQLAEALLDEADAACTAGSPPARVRISSIEPLSIDQALVDVLKSAQGRICRHLHIPLQSGSSKVLHEMNRPYSAEYFLDLVDGLREEVPHIALSTDIITGFPGETDHDFEATCEAVQHAEFMRLHVFPYSRRNGTPAAERADQIPDDVKRARAAHLRELGRQLAEHDLEKRAGTEELCLVEGRSCLSESYHELPAPSRSAPGQLVAYRFPELGQTALSSLHPE